jgi:alkylhydroperoxidase family enzyme
VAATQGPRIPPLPPDEWSEELRPLAAFAASGEELSLGDLNIFRTLARHPALFQSWAPFGGWLLTQATLSFEDRELVILRTGFNCGSPYEWGQHVRIALNGGMSRETIDRVAEGPDAEGWSPREAALLRAADDLHASARISDANWDALIGELDERQLIELCVLVGQYHLVAFMLNSVGVEPEPGLDPLPDRP